MTYNLEQAEHVACDLDIALPAAAATVRAGALQEALDLIAAAEDESLLQAYDEVHSLRVFGRAW